MAFDLGMSISASEAPPPPAATSQEITASGGWSWFQDPRAICSGGKVFIGWLDNAGNVKVAAYDIAARTLTTATLKAFGLPADDHNDPTIWIRPDGRVVVFYSKHNGNAIFYKISTNPGDISSFGVEKTVHPDPIGDLGLTYPNPIYLPAEDRLYLFFRGNFYQPTFVYSDDHAETWTIWSGTASGRAVVHTGGFVPGPGTRPYAKYCSNGVDTIHFFMATGHPRDFPNDLHHFIYRGGNLRKTDDTLIKALTAAPLNGFTETGLLYDHAEAGVAWNWDLALDDDGHPVITFAVFPDWPTCADHRYRYGRWTGSAWETHEITPAGGTIYGVSGEEDQYSGGVMLDHNDPSRVYLSRPVSGQFELESWHTPDGGVTWDSPVAITVGSGSRKNVRPVPVYNHVDGAPEVLWMRGRYTRWTDWDTAIRCSPAVEVV